MTVPRRLRRFCPYCGAIIAPDRAACSAHRDLVQLDAATSREVVTAPGWTGSVRSRADAATDRRGRDGADRA